eukprot:Pompholyxophrys_punicea_v1_NODE_2_length_10808_cov_35.677950.p3 type:complete len:264 gc:universal NODE_2_length_10808_cov_35.677950:3375-4166(+)
MSQIEGLQTYRASIALNNMGVALLGRGNATAARDALRGSIAAMKTFVDYAKGNGGSEFEVPTEEIENIVRRASRCLAQSELLCSPFANVLSDENLAEAADAALHIARSSSFSIGAQAYAFRIDSTDFNDYEETYNDEVGRNMAIVFHNYAVACRIMGLSSASRHDEAANMHMAVSTKAFDLSYRTLLMLQKSVSHRDDGSELCRIITLAIFAVHGIARNSIDSGLGGEAMKHGTTLNGLREMLMDVLRIEQATGIQKLIAAAA